MKAYCWAKKFNEAFSKKEDVFDIIDEFVAEVSQLIALRTQHSKTEKFVKAAREGALNEAKLKWQSILNRCPQLIGITFDQIMRKAVAA